VLSPVRLQQLLSVFFPAACAQKALRDALVGSVPALLERATHRKLRAPVLAKMLDYCVSTAEQGRAMAAADQPQGEEPESSPGLVAAVGVAEFLSSKATELNTTTLRALCKMVGQVEIVVEDELYDHLSTLKELLEELGNVIDDSTSLRSLVAVTEQLADVEMEEEVDEDDEEEVAAVAAPEEEDDSPVGTAKENEMVPPDSDDDAETLVDTPVSKTAARDSVRRSSGRRRRLTPSN